MQAYFIDAAARTISVFEHSDYSFRAYLPNGPCIGQIFANGDVLYVDERALLQKATIAFRIKDRPDGQPMMCNGVLTGPDNATDTDPPGFSVSELAEHIEWLTVDEALAWFRAKRDEPAVTSTADGITFVHAEWSDLLANLEGNDGYQPDRDESLLRRL